MPGSYRRCRASQLFATTRTKFSFGGAFLPCFLLLCCVRLQRRRFCAVSIPAFIGAGLRAGEDDRAFSARRVWSGRDTNLLGAPSLDGRFLSFVDTQSGDLAVLDLATGGKRRLTSHSDEQQFAYFSSLSPDSHLIAYAWFNEEKFYELRVAGLD